MLMLAKCSNSICWELTFHRLTSSWQFLKTHLSRLLPNKRSRTKWKLAYHGRMLFFSCTGMKPRTKVILLNSTWSLANVQFFYFSNQPLPNHITSWWTFHCLLDNWPSPTINRTSMTLWPKHPSEQPCWSMSSTAQTQNSLLPRDGDIRGLNHGAPWPVLNTNSILVTTMPDQSRSYIEIRFGDEWKTCLVINGNHVCSSMMIILGKWQKDAKGLAFQRQWELHEISRRTSSTFLVYVNQQKFIRSPVRSCSGCQCHFHPTPGWMYRGKIAS